MLVGRMALLCGAIPQEKLSLLCNHDNFSRLLSTFVDSRVTNLVLAMHAMHEWPVYCDLILALVKA